MTLEIVHNFRCDLCDNADIGYLNQPPSDWIKIVIENCQLERDFIAKHVCKNCVKRIVQQINK